MKCFMQDITKGKRQGNQKMGTDSESKKPMKTTSPTSFLSQEGSYLVIINYAHPLQPHTGGSSGGVSPPHPQVAGLEKIEHEIRTPSADTVTEGWVPSCTTSVLILYL